MGVFNVVPGNIKQQMLPFLLNPNSDLNLGGVSGDGYRKSDPQYFTYRNNTRYMWSGKGMLNFCPKSVKDSMKDDISYKLLYNQGKTTSVDFASMFDKLPGIQIREFLPDTALDQCINFFTDLFKSVMTMFSGDGISVKADDATKQDGKKLTAGDDSSAGFFDKLYNVTWFLMKYLTGNTYPTNIVSSALVMKNFNRQYDKNFNRQYDFTGDKKTVSMDLRIVDFPYMLYYRFLSCTTTGIYELPIIKQDKRMYSSDGAPGWEDSAGFSMMGDTPLKAASAIPGVGSLLSKMFGNINVSFMPWWNALKGNATPEPSVEVEFDLFNDTVESALINFIFVNTLIPNNKWIQYGLFQLSSHLYDIKLEGYNRLFACTGKFEVFQKGVLRDPPENWFEPSGPLAKYLNTHLIPSKFLTTLKDEKSIKIPDVYNVKMTFNSVLPANFNQYLYTLVANTNAIDTYYTHTYDQSQMVDALTNGIKGMIAGAKNAWNHAATNDYTKSGYDSFEFTTKST